MNNGKLLGIGRCDWWYPIERYSQSGYSKINIS